MNHDQDNSDSRNHIDIEIFVRFSRFFTIIEAFMNFFSKKSLYLIAMRYMAEVYLNFWKKYA